jgi:hypothetical protein
MQQNINKTVNEIRKEDLQTVTGGCATCVGLGSLALQEAREAAANARRNTNNTTLANKEINRAFRLQQLSRQGQENANKPVLEGCRHCQDAASLMKRIAPRLRY